MDTIINSTRTGYAYIREFQVPAMFGVSIDTVRSWNLPAYKPSPKIKLYRVEDVVRRIEEAACPRVVLGEPVRRLA
jgi:hypothetical protein